MVEARDVTVRLRADIAQFQAATLSAGKSMGTLADKITAADKQSQKMRNGLDQLGGTAGKIGLVAGAGLLVAVAASARFEKSMSAVAAATNATGGDLDALGKAAIKAGADTVFSATEAADGITELGKAGLSTSDILNGGLSGALDLAAAGQIGVAEAAETTATTLSQFALSGDQASRVADTLAAAAGKSLGSVTDMGEALKYVGPVAQQMGVSLEETSGSIALLASQGILGSQAGTSLRGMLSSLTSPSAMAANEMKILGISMYDAQGEFIGLDGIAGQLQSTMGTLSNAERDAALGRIFGNEQITAARVLYAGGAGAVQDWTAKVTDSGFAAEQAAKLTDNLAGDIEAFTGSLETALIGLGAGSQGSLRSLVQGATDAVNAFSELSPTAQTAVTAMLGVTAVTGGALWFGAKVIGGIADTRAALSDLGMTAGTSRRALSAIGKGVELVAIIEGVKLLDDALAGLTDARLEGDLTRNLSALANGEIVGNLDNMGKYVRSVNSSFAEGQNKAFGWIPGKTEFSEASDEIKKVDEAMAQLVESGNGSEAAAIMAQIVKQSAAQGIGVGETTKVFDQYNLALKTAAIEAQPVLGPTAAMSEAFVATGGAAGQTAEQIEAMAEALKKSREAATETAGSFFNLGDGLNDSKVSLGDWIGQMEKQAAALRNFRKNAIDAADNGLRGGLIRALQEAGPEGAMRMGQLADATDDEIGRANRAWKRGQEQINGYTDDVGGVPNAVGTEVIVASAAAERNIRTTKGGLGDINGSSARARIDIDNSGATSAISTTIGMLAALQGKTTTTFIDTVRRNAPSAKAGEAIANQISRAAGGPVYGPGTSTSDSIPANLSTGEYVIKASSVDRYGVGLFDRLNAQSYAVGGLVENFAEGGEAGKKKPKGPSKAQQKKFRAQLKAQDKAGDLLGDFKIDISLDADGLSSALEGVQEDYAKIRDLFKDGGLVWSKARRADVERLSGLARTYDGLNVALKNSRDAQAAFAFEVSTAFNNDIFGNGLAGLSIQLQADANDTAAFQAALGSAVAQGLDGGLRDALFRSGDLNTAQQLAASGAGGIATLEAQFNERGARQSQLGSFAGQVTRGAEVSAGEAAVVGELKELRREVKRLEGAVERGARDGSREGSRDGSREGTRGANQDRQTQTTQTTQTTSRGGRNGRGGR